MKVVIIGTGNVATVLGRKIKLAGHDILQVIGRSQEKASSLAHLLKASTSCNILEISTEAEIAIVSVPDELISTICENLRVEKGVVVHTAGAITKDVLAQSGRMYGVLYPLQSLKKEQQRLPAIPVLIDGDSPQTIETLQQFASDWADSVTVANDEDRLKTHIAAVFANNFTNYLYAKSVEFCELEHLNFNTLYPIIEETIVRMKGARPSALQTGPAVRKDVLTIEKHLKILEQHPKLKFLYNTLTNSILNDPLI
ncbi:MAG: hypothetical protein JWQ96_2597 [Segetibacter sp.]|nr:hypothetical protein [Segetibacter sp.]